MRITDRMVQRLIRLDRVHLEWWHPRDVSRWFGNRHLNDITRTFSVRDRENKLIPVFMIEKITLIDYEQVEVMGNFNFPFTHG